jgi:hypothetical protein
MKSPSPRAAKPHPQPTHVVKRMAPTQPGAIKLAEQYGEQLVCVRYRHDPAGRYRYTTVELVVAHGPVKPRSVRRAPKIQIVALRLSHTEDDLRTLVRAHGAVCDRRTGLWYIPRTTARALGLLPRVV